MPEPEGIPAEIARAELGSLLSRVQYGSESITILKYGKPVARLVPIEEQQRAGPIVRTEQEALGEGAA
jgi:prevent-host-death family protein